MQSCIAYNILQPMTRIGLLSDTHGWLDEKIFPYLRSCDELWHAGDIGSAEVVRQLQTFCGGPFPKKLRMVWGNIDGEDVRKLAVENLRFRCEQVDVLMTHIGGRPGRYNSRINEELQKIPPKIFVCGHSHILLVEMDKKLGCLHLNPGAAGRHGFHQVRTLLLFEIDGEKIQNLKVVEMGKRT